MLPVGIFGFSNFATAFFTLRVAQILQPELSVPMATAAAVGFYLAHNAVGTAVSFPAGWLADRVGKAPILAAAYLTFGLACLVAIVGHGWLAVGLLALLVGAEAPVVVSVEQSLAGSLVEELRQRLRRSGIQRASRFAVDGQPRRRPRFWSRTERPGSRNPVARAHRGPREFKAWPLKSWGKNPSN
jgi:MFS family permease